MAVPEWQGAQARLAACRVGFKKRAAGSDGLRLRGCLAEEGRPELTHGVLLDIPHDQDEAGPVVGIRPGIELDRRMQDLLDGVNEQRPAGLAGDVHQPFQP